MGAGLELAVRPHRDYRSLAVFPGAHQPTASKESYAQQPASLAGM
jgi:hypothetical protein